MKQKLKILLTFDYEIAFGANLASWQAVLFQPAAVLADTLRNEKIPGTFFADILSWDAFAESPQAGADYCDDFRAQLQAFLQQGHDVQMHLHPHWIGSAFDTQAGQWRFNFGHYSYGDLVGSIGHEPARDILAKGHTKLAEICGCDPIAFRAGGYSVEPNPSTLIADLVALGYRYDSSVNPYRKRSGAVHKFDFLQLPDTNTWHIAAGSGFGVDAGTGVDRLLEFPLVGIQNKGLDRVQDKLWKAWKRRNPEAVRLRRSLDKGLNATGASDQTGLSVDKSLGFNFDQVTVYDVPRMLWLTRRYMAQYSSASTVYMTLIAHPKGMQQPALDALVAYARSARARFDCEFVTFRDLPV